MPTEKPDTKKGTVANLAGSALRHARRVVIVIVGVTIILFGIALLVLPGPGTVVIPLGLAILGIEFAWARRLLHRAHGLAKSAVDRTFRRERPGSGGKRPRRDAATDDAKRESEVR